MFSYNHILFQADDACADLEKEACCALDGCIFAKCGDAEEDGMHIVLLFSKIDYLYFLSDVFVWI